MDRRFIVYDKDGNVKWTMIVNNKHGAVSVPLDLTMLPVTKEIYERARKNKRSIRIDITTKRPRLIEIPESQP